MSICFDMRVCQHLKERTKRLSQEKEITEEGIRLIETWEAKDHDLSDSVIDEDKLKLQDLHKNIHILSLIMIQEQMTSLKMNLALQSLMREAGEKWSASKYSFTNSGMKTSIPGVPVTPFRLCLHGPAGGNS